MIIAIDFDGTCVMHDYPDIGQDVPLAAETLRELVAKGHLQILNTMRSGERLEDAVKWFKERFIPLWGVNKNPHQHEWTDSPKVYANIYIDDAGYNCPLIKDSSIHHRAFVDWSKITI